MADDNANPISETGLPAVDAPSISPAVEAPSISPAAPAPEAPEAATAAALLVADAAKPAPWFTARMAVFAVSVVLAGALGGVFGALATGAKPNDLAAEHERQAMQQSLARLSKELVTVRSELAAADRTAKTQTARVTELDKKLRENFARDAAIVTGSIAPPTSAPAAAPPTATSTPMPPPRPAMQQARDGVAPGWTVLGMRHGFVYVQSGRDIYRVAPGARLPGLGVVEDIRREAGDWVVYTRRGMIVASRERY